MRRVGEQGGLVLAGAQALVAVGGGVGERVERARVRHDAGHELQAERAEIGVALAGEGGPAAAPQRLVHVQPDARPSATGLGMKVATLP